MTDLSDDAWFAVRTAGAPELLSARAEQFFRQSDARDLTARLSEAGRQALDAATRGGADRAAALDLLAADALITLALLATAERNPAGFADVTAGLRHQGTSPP